MISKKLFYTFLIIISVVIKCTIAIKFECDIECNELKLHYLSYGVGWLKTCHSFSPSIEVDYYNMTVRNVVFQNDKTLDTDSIEFLDIYQSKKSNFFH